MQQIDNLSDGASQATQVVLDDGTVVFLTLAYHAATQRWVLSVSYAAFALNGLNLCAGANVLAPWANQLPFGLACDTTDGVDPAYINDFVGVAGGEPRAKLYVLSAAEVLSAAAGTFG